MLTIKQSCRGRSFAALKELLANTPADDVSASQVADIKAAQEKMMASAQSLFTKMYENMQAQQGGAQGAGPDMGAGAQGGAAPEDDHQ